MKNNTFKISDTSIYPSRLHLVSYGLNLRTVYVQTEIQLASFLRVFEEFVEEFVTQFMLMRLLPGPKHFYFDTHFNFNTHVIIMNHEQFTYRVFNNA